MIRTQYMKSIMNSWRLIFRRNLTTERKDIGQIFIKEDVQKLLKEITRFEEKKIFARRPVPKLRSPKLMFMTDDQLEKAKAEAYQQVEARLQMPPVMAPDTSEPAIISRDEEIVGYTKFKVMFVDITPGYSNRSRLMSVREVDGTLRFPTHSERSRLNHMFYPSEFRSIDEPKLFQEDNLLKLLKRKEYTYVLNRACVQFEPDDPRYHHVTSTVYDYIDDRGDYDNLRSTRHFGPLSLYLAYNKRMDSLLLEMLIKNFVDDAVRLVKLFYTCHDIKFKDDDNSLDILKNYVELYSTRKYNIDLAIQDLENKKASSKPEEEKENVE